MATTPNPTMGQATAVAGLLDSYAASQMQQMQNAQIGRIGTAPAQMGEVQTQGLTA